MPARRLRAPLLLASVVSVRVGQTTVVLCRLAYSRAPTTCTGRVGRGSVHFVEMFSWDTAGPVSISFDVPDVSRMGLSFQSLSVCVRIDCARNAEYKPD